MADGKDLEQHFHDCTYHFAYLTQYIIILKHLYSPFQIHDSEQ